MSYTLGYNTPVVDASSCRSLFECIQICEIYKSNVRYENKFIINESKYTDI